MDADGFLRRDHIGTVINMAVQRADDIHLVMVQHPQQFPGACGQYGQSKLRIPAAKCVEAPRNDTLTQRIRHTKPQMPPNGAGISGFMKKFLKEFFLSLIISIILIMILAIILSKTSVTEEIITPSIIFISSLSVMIGSFRISKNKKEKGIINGIFFGIIYMFSLYLISSIFTRSFVLTGDSILMICIGIVTGIIGGIIGVNLR